MRSFQATYDLLAVSALLRETAINTEQTLSHGMLCDLGVFLNYDRRRESNADEAIGKEEPDSLYDLGALASMSLKFSKAQAQHIAFILAYGLGSVATVAAGSTGYKHTLIPIVGDLDGSRSNPSFTAAMRYGKQLLKQRLASCFVDSFTLSMKKDAWVTIEAAVKSTGKRTTNMTEESITAAYNAISLTLAANGVAGSTAQERLDNVHAIRVLVPSTGEWKDVVYSAVSGASPAIITISAPGGVATSTTYKVLYNIVESGSYAWCSFPSRVVEPPLRTGDFLIKFGGLWDGSQWLEGHAMQGEIKGLDWTFNQALSPEFVPGAGTTGYANRAIRDGRTQTIKLDRDFRDYIVANRADLTETFMLYAIAEGTEYEAGHKYTVEIIWPQVAVLSAPVNLDGKRLAEAGDLTVLEHDTYGSVIVNIKNKVATYAA